MDTLFHYTDLNAFLSIIQSKKLWLTGAYNLNDSQEIYWAQKKIGSSLNKFAAKHGKQRADDIWGLLQASSGVPYMCSLSSEDDLLSQWRAYGKNGTGVAIGFKCGSLPSSERLPILTYGKKDSLSLHQVIYDEKEQEKLIELILSPVFDMVESDDQPHMAISMAALKLVGLSSIFKNPAFSEEKEWRIIHRPIIMGKDGSRESMIRQSISPPRYRTSGGKLISYFEYDFADLKPEEIFSEIVLGPKSEVSNYDLSILLTESGLANLNVRRSKSSYR